MSLDAAEKAAELFAKEPAGDDETDALKATWPMRRRAFVEGYKAARRDADAATFVTEPIAPKPTGAGKVLGVYLDGQPLESAEALEELRHLVEALKQTTARLDLVATRHDERLATLEHERGRRLLTEQENAKAPASCEGAATRADRDNAYNERNRLVALLARIYPSGIRKTAIEGWDPCWHGCVFVDTPMGQMSWHYHERDADLFAGLPPYTKDWDGHSTPEKYERLAQLTRSYWARTPEPAGITTGIGESWREGYREALNEAFREGRRRERASLIGYGDGVTVIVRDYPTLIGDVVSGCKALKATRVLVDAAGPGASVLRHLEQAGLPAEALPKGAL